MSPTPERSPCTNTFVLLRLALTLAICCPALGTAQDTSATRGPATRRLDGWIVGPSVGMPTADGFVIPELATFGLNFTKVSPHRLGGDFSVGTMPYVLANGFAAVGVRADVTYPVSISPYLLLLPAGGLSVIGAAGDGGGGGGIGFNAGLAAVIHGDSPAGLRLGVMLHQFTQANIPILLVEVGVVHLPRSEP
jgi:hypothetical protein